MNKDFIVGNWQGFFNVGKTKLAINFIISRNNHGNFTVNLISPTQGRKVEANNA
ncbi:MAG: hypothetical protein ACFE91_06960 [Promethearchaeota archaeon]